MNNINNNPATSNQPSKDSSRGLGVFGVLISAFSFFFLTVFHVDLSDYTYFEAIGDTMRYPILPPFDNILTIILIFAPLLFLTLCILAIFRRKKVPKGLAITSMVTYIMGMLMYVTIQSYGPKDWLIEWESVHKFPILLFIIGMVIVSKNAVPNQPTCDQ